MFDRWLTSLPAFLIGRLLRYSITNHKPKGFNGMEWKMQWDLCRLSYMYFLCFSWAGFNTRAAYNLTFTEPIPLCCVGCIWHFDQHSALTSGIGYLSWYGSTSVRGTVILFGSTTKDATTSSITPLIMSLQQRQKKNIRKLQTGQNQLAESFTMYK